VTHRRPLALYRYPVAEEIVAYGFTFFGLDDLVGISGFLKNGDDALLDTNIDIARRHFNCADLPRRLATLLAPMGITS
jgi:hypothetical protein